MAQDIAFPTADTPGPALRWIGRGSLTRRILALNIVALVLVGGSLFYLDGFRTRLIQERRIQEESKLRIVAAALGTVSPSLRPTILDAAARSSGDHLRIYDSRGALQFDSWLLGPRSFRFADPAKEDWPQRAARWLDAIVDRLVVATIPPPFIDQGRASATKWPEIVDVINGAKVGSRVRLAPDRTIVTSAAIAIGQDRSQFLLSVRNPQDVTRLVREERLRIAEIVVLALLLSAALSYFLARTIVQPLRRLALAAVRVRLGRAREVVVPRLPSRSDEIGLLARAVSDMTQALRERIDASERFAADVSHELKNPLASLSSAVESLGKVTDPGLQAQLTGIIAQDVHRLDRLITDIADISRLDAQLTRTSFARVDLGVLIARLLTEFGTHHSGGIECAFSQPAPDTAVVLAEADRLERAIRNLVDNAVSFSPVGGTIRIASVRVGEQIVVTVEDDGPGIAPAARGVVFERFHSDRPESDAFGQHSGLGLAIAKTIVEGHNGSIAIEDRDSGASGARFVIRLPAA